MVRVVRVFLSQLSKRAKCLYYIHMCVRGKCKENTLTTLTPSPLGSRRFARVLHQLAVPMPQFLWGGHAVVGGYAFALCGLGVLK